MESSGLFALSRRLRRPRHGVLPKNNNLSGCFPDPTSFHLGRDWESRCVEEDIPIHLWRRDSVPPSNLSWDSIKMSNVTNFEEKLTCFKKIVNRKQTFTMYVWTYSTFDHMIRLQLRTEV